MENMFDYELDNDLKKLKILVADDEMVQIEFLKRILSVSFSNIDFVENGKSGFELFNIKHHDIVISDIGMPIINGIQMTKKIKAINNKTKIILMTANLDRQFMIDAIDIGVNQFLSKPLSKEQIFQSLNRVISLIKLENANLKQIEKINVLSSALECATNFIVITDDMFKITYVNQSFLNYSNFNELNLIGNSFFKFLIKSFDVEKLVRESLLVHDFWQGEFMIHTDDSSMFWAHCSSSKIIDVKNNIKGYVFILDDISDQKISNQNLLESNNLMRELIYNRTKELEEINHKLNDEIKQRIKTEAELKIAKILAEKANNTKSVFLAKVSHELRTPMNGILGMLSLIKNTNLDELQQHRLSVIRKSSESLLKIINDVLDYAKITSGKFQFNENNFNFRELMLQLFNLIEPELLVKKIDFNYNIDENIPEILFGDSIRINQILINLLGNSIKFTESGFVKFEVELDSTTDLDKVLLFKISDSGIGISENVKDIIFESFRQAEPTMTRKYGGTGLGLAISKEIAESLGGEIWFESEVGKGTTFFVKIKIKSETNAKIISSRISILQENFDLKILVIEDSEINIEILNEILKSTKCFYDIKTFGRDGINAFNKRIYDVVLLDINLQDINGIEVIEQMHKSDNFDNQYIIAMTGYCDDESIITFISSGFDDVLVKPFDKEQLLSLLSIIRNKNLENFTPVDLKKLLKSIKNNPDVLERLVKYLIENLQQELDEIKKFMEIKQKDKLKFKLHKLKSELAHFGAKSAVDSINKLEKVVSEDSTDNFEEEFHYLCFESNLILKFLKSFSINELIIQFEV
jgi:PAS domain S-box-containing protein